MAKTRRPAEARASLVVEGDAQEILGEARKIRGGNKRVTIILTVRGGSGFPEEYYLPVIEGGKMATTLKTLRGLCAQGRISLDDEKRVIDLIEQFKPLT